MKKLTVKEIIKCKGSKKLSEVYTHNPLEAAACEAAGIEMIVSSELNDIDGIRDSAKNTFLTVGLKYGSYLNEFEIVKRSFELINIGADAIYCPQSHKLIKAISDEGIPVVGHSGFIPYKSTFYGGFKAYGKNALEAQKILHSPDTADAAKVDVFVSYTGETGEQQIAAIEANASPRNPKVRIRNKSSSSIILLVACLSTAS